MLEKSDLINYIAAGSKPKDAWRIGAEHEQFSFNKETGLPLTYGGENGVYALLKGMEERFDWEPILENGKPIAMKKGKKNLSLEPAGQIELSGAPLETLHDICLETRTFQAEIRAIGDDLGIGFLAAGTHPQWTREQMNWMPKARYGIMRNYMPKKGKYGLDMMTRTCTVQVNVDYSDEADMVQKFRVSIALQPLITALYASSPMLGGKDTGYKSFRSHIWTDTDPDRTGILPFVFDEDMGFERYVDWVLDVPMYFVRRNGEYIDAAGQSFRDFMKGELPALPGEYPTIEDWEDHMSTPFPEVRLKQYLEMRGADSGSKEMICALPTFFAGLLYDQQALDEAWDMVKDWPIELHKRLRDETPKYGLNTEVIDGKTWRAIGVEVLEIIHNGLNRQDYCANSHDFLNVLHEKLKES